MTIQEACKEVRAIANNMGLDYCDYYDYKWTKEKIAEDLTENIRMLNYIIIQLYDEK